MASVQCRSGRCGHIVLCCMWTNETSGLFCINLSKWLIANRITVNLTCGYLSGQCIHCYSLLVKLYSLGTISCDPVQTIVSVHSCFSVNLTVFWPPWAHHLEDTPPPSAPSAHRFLDSSFSLSNVGMSEFCNFDNFCIKLTRNEQRISAYQNVSLHLACVSTLACKIRKQCFFSRKHWNVYTKTWVARSLRRRSSKPRLLQFSFGNSLTNCLAPYFFDSDKFLIRILSSFVVVFSYKCHHSSVNDVFMTSL